MEQHTGPLCKWVGMELGELVCGAAHRAQTLDGSAESKVFTDLCMSDSVAASGGGGWGAFISGFWQQSNQ